MASIGICNNLHMMAIHYFKTNQSIMVGVLTDFG